MYKNLYKVASELARANEFELKPLSQWPMIQEFDLSKLEEQAACLTDEELKLFVDGDETDVFNITEKYKIDLLRLFIDELFEGWLHKLLVSWGSYVP